MEVVELEVAGDLEVHFAVFTVEANVVLANSDPAFAFTASTKHRANVANATDWHVNGVAYD